jgi:uncharacterized repeat protein (TIGR01451 family)/fimbrial isopeptide formation D2 family protein
MKRKTGLSLMTALLMILSTLVVVTPSGASSEIFIVEKQVSNGEGWHDSIHAVYGDIVQFKITVTYNGEHCAENIVATDTLPPCLEYVKTLEPENIVPTINGNILVWDLGETYLDPYGSTDIIFEAKVIGIGENVNTVNVTAIECCPDHDIYGVDTATVIVDSSVDVQKNVWDPEEQKWVDELGWVIKGQNVRFRIAITYHGTDLMKCMTVDDYLGYCPYGCLDYADNVKFTYPSTQFEDPEITVSENLKYIEFNWTKSLFNLHGGESIIIEFDANVTKYSTYPVINHAYVDIWSCECCTHLFGEDSATVNCVPHPPIFNKKVYNGEEYVEKATVYVNDTIRFKIELTYYGNENLTDIKIIDELPCILKYVGNEKVKIVHSAEQAIEILEINGTASEDKKIIWWNLTNELSDCDTLSIEFDALVTGITGDCGDCGINTASYTGYSNGNDYSGSDTAQISSTHKPPAQPTKIDICVKRISFGRIRGNIKNLGETDLSNVECIISVKGGIRNRINLTANETIEKIKAGGPAPICSEKGSIKRMFGRIEITITVIVGGESFKETFKGFVLGRLVIVRPLLRR